MNRRWGLLLLIALVVGGGGARAAAPLNAEGVRQRLIEAGVETPKGAVRRSQLLPGFYELELGGRTLYVDASGGHFFAGDLYLLQGGGLVNATEAARQDMRLELLASIAEDDMLVFTPPADEVKATITVFTDIDCGYCRLLHQEMPELNRLGIAVRYLAYPRAGPGSESFDKIVSAWCAEDPLDAMTRAKAGQAIEPLRCASPVAQQYELGARMGVTGTPAILFDNGQLQAGYAPAAEMARRLGLSD